MRVVRIHAERDLRVEEMPRPVPGPGEVSVAMEAGGICGSDLHYYQHGGFGTVRLKEPMILGHEVAGRIAAVGPGVDTLSVGMRVAVNPSLPCGRCKFCLEGAAIHCLDMRFYGSAMRFPHVQGGFRETLVCEAVRCVPVAPATSAGEAAFAEPLAVTLHAARRAGPLLGRRVLVVGCGPIGALAILVARRAGAAEIVATDVAAGPLAVATKVGADRVHDVAIDPDAPRAYAADKGTFDVLFECSGNGRALAGAIEAVRPRGIVVQVGVGGEIALPMGAIVARELELRGTFRFHEEFAIAVDMIGKGLIDVKPLLTATLPIERAVEAFDLAGDRKRSVKVQLAFG